jgi:hypothetical protein
MKVLSRLRPSLILRILYLGDSVLCWWLCGGLERLGRVMEKVLADAEKAKSLAGREAKGGGIATGPPPETTHMDHDARL